MKKYIFVFILIVLYFGGLNSVRELGDLAIVKAVSIDKNENGEYEICAIVIDTKEKQSKEVISFTELFCFFDNKRQVSTNFLLPK